MQVSFSLKNINEVARQLWQQHQHTKVWAFHGEMGSGKTTFIHALCEALVVTSAIGSPTYSIINEYKSAAADTIFHLDLYRLRDEEEALQAGVEDVLYSNHLCLVEWPERAQGLLPPDCLHLYIEITDMETRTISW